jgi:hypothetical protein
VWPAYDAVTIELAASAHGFSDRSNLTRDLLANAGGKTPEAKRPCGTMWHLKKPRPSQ